MILAEMVKSVTGCDDLTAVSQLELAELDILRETNRKSIPSALLSLQIDIAVIRINKLGSEGEISRSQGGVNVSYESLPDYIHKTVKNWRLAGVGGHAFEQKKNETTLR